MDMVERSHGILRSARDIDSDRLYDSNDKLDRSGVRCKQLDYINWNDNRYDLNRLEPELNTVKLGYIKLGFYEYMVYIEVLSRPERNPIDFHVK